jgi:hypothetical protein
MSEDKDKPKPQLPRPGNAPTPKKPSTKEYGDGDSVVIDIESDKD